MSGFGTTPPHPKKKKKKKKKPKKGPNANINVKSHICNLFVCNFYMLHTVPEDLCLLGCVFFITDYQRYLSSEQIMTWKKVIAQHGGQVDDSYSNRVTHLLCETQQSDVFVMVSDCTTWSKLGDSAQHGGGVIAQHGGQVDDSYSDRVTHLLCETQQSDVFVMVRFLRILFKRSCLGLVVLH